MRVKKVALITALIIYAFGFAWMYRKTSWLSDELSFLRLDHMISRGVVSQEFRRVESLNEDIHRAFLEGMFLLEPVENKVYQQIGGSAKIDVSALSAHTPPPKMVLISNGSKREVRNGDIIDLSAGAYKICYSIGLDEYCRQFAVGEVFLVVGQSNAASETKHPVKSETGMVFISKPGIPLKFSNPFFEPTSFGAAWVFAGDILSRHYERPIGFVVVAAGSTGSHHWTAGGYLHHRIQEGLLAHRPRAVLWHQGETDCLLSFSPSISFSNMKSMIEAAGASHSAPWMVALNTVSSDRRCPVRAAQRQIIDAGLAVEGPDTDFLEKSNEHFEGETLRKHGQMWAQKLIESKLLE